MTTEQKLREHFERLMDEYYEKGDHRREGSRFIGYQDCMNDVIPLLTEAVEVIKYYETGKIMWCTGEINTDPAKEFLTKFNDTVGSDNDRIL